MNMICSIGLFNVENIEIYTSDTSIVIARYVENIEIYIHVWIQCNWYSVENVETITPVKTMTQSQIQVNYMHCYPYSSTFLLPGLPCTFFGVVGKLRQ